VFAALQQLWRSTDSGATWNTVTAATLGGNQADALLPGAFTARGHSPSTCLLHWDHHELVFSPPTQWPPPADPDRPISTAYFGTDGGIARSDDGGATYVSLNEGLATALLDDMDIGRGANNAVTYGGMQDLGTAGHRSDDADGTWVAGIDSDGNYTAVDPADGKTVLGFNANKLMWTPNGGESWFVEGFPARPVITEVRNTNPVGVATTGHPFQTGDTVTVARCDRRRWNRQWSRYGHTRRQFRSSTERKERNGRGCLQSRASHYRRALSSVPPHHRGRRHGTYTNHNLRGTWIRHRGSGAD